MDCGAPMSETKLMRSVWAIHQQNLKYGRELLKDVMESNPDKPLIYTKDMRGWGAEFDFILDITEDNMALITNTNPEWDCDTITIKWDERDIRQTRLPRILGVFSNLTTGKCEGAQFNDGFTWSGECFESVWANGKSSCPSNLLKKNGEIKKKKNKKKKYKKRKQKRNGCKKKC